MKKNALLIILNLLPVIITEVNSQTTRTFTPESANSYLVDTCYDVIKWPSGYTFNWGYSSLVIANTLSDDAHAGGSDINDQPFIQECDNYNATPDYTGFADGGTLWDKYYEGIRRCNVLLDASKEGTSTSMDRYIAEAKFIRAYFYLELVRYFGGVPLILTANIPENPNYARNSVSEVYNKIETDLIAAIAQLPKRSDLANSEKDRATVGSAKALLGKIYLYQKKYTDAITVFKTLADDTNYALKTNYADLFNSSNKNGIENIFEVNYENGSGNNLIQLCGPRSNDIQIDTTHGSGWGFCQPSTDLVNAFQAQNDIVRLNATAISNDSLQKLHNIFVKSAYPNGQPINWVNSISGYWDNKLMPNPLDTMMGAFWNFKSNRILIRLADVYLMLAEAYSQTGDDANARLYLNKVRNRVNLASVTSSGDALYAAIKLERRLELALEGERYFDLVRWGDAETVLHSLDYSEGTPGVKSFGLLPIPQVVIDNNNNILQNPGYDIPTQNLNLSTTSNNMNVKIWPNPVIAQAEISYELPIQGNVQVLLFSIDGKVAKNIHLSKQTIGRHDYKLDVANVENGVYFLFVKSENLNNIRKIIIIK